MMGYDFHRQKPLDRYIVDFFCQELMLVIEIDGFSHEDELRALKDVQRQERLESFGIHFLRFSDIQIKQDMNQVLETIEWWIEGHQR